MAGLAALAQLPPWNKAFAEQLAFFKKKLNLPSERWDDIMLAAHDRAHIVAGAQGADLLADLNAAIAKAIEQGTGLEAFRKDFKALVAKHGWTGWTGEESAARTAWRTKVIYQTNMATSYAAGRWQQLNDPELLKALPYWQYKHNDSVLTPRPLHVGWNGLTLPAGHAFWNTHYPPNGWGCHCRVVPVGKAAFMKAIADGRGPADAPAAGNSEGIDQGFAYAPGANASRPLQDFIDQKLLRLDAPIGAQMWRHLQPALEAEQEQAWQSMVSRVVGTMKATGETRLAHVVAPATVQNLIDAGIPLENAAVWLRDDELLHAMRDTKDVRGAALPLDVWRDLRHHLEQAVPYLDTVDSALIYVFDTPDGLGKMVVRVNYKEKGRFNGVRDRITSNFIRTGGLIDTGDLPEVRYKKLEK